MTSTKYKYIVYIHWQHIHSFDDKAGDIYNTRFLQLLCQTNTCHFQKQADFQDLFDFCGKLANNIHVFGTLHAANAFYEPIEPFK